MHTCFPSNSKIVKEIAKNVRFCSMQMKAMSLRVGKAQRRRHEGATEEAENPECRCEHGVEEEEVQVEIESSPEEGDEEEEESDEVKEREWIAEPEPGVLMTLVARPDGRNHLKKIRFREELFDTWAAQSWWAENYERIVELYSIAQNRVPVTPYQSEEEVGTDQDRDSGTTSSCSGPSGGSGDTLGSPILGLVTAAGGNLRAEQNTAEWVEEYESGVFITVRGHPDGRKELRRVELSRERFGEVKARVWWEENKFVLQKLYSC